MMKRTSLFILLLLSYFFAFPQGVGINNSGAPADSSAILDVSSTTQGMLLPRMTQNQRNLISNPADGLTIFNVTTNCFNIYYLGSWHELCPGCIPPNPPAVSSNSPVCAGDTLKLFASAIPGANYSWSGPNGFTSILQNPVIPNASQAATGVYTLNVSWNNCPANSVSTSVVVNNLPSANFSASPSPTSINVATVFSPVTIGAQYSWIFQNGSPSTSTQQNPSVSWSNPGTYNISLTVTQNGCSNSHSDTILVSTCFVHGQSSTFIFTGGVQTWTVPAGVCTVTIDAYGAQGGDNPARTGGYGAQMRGDFVVSPGEVLTIVVGGKGQNGISYSGYTGAGGGGGTGVLRNGNILVIAGGGGGAGHQNNGLPGLTGTCGGCGFNQSNPCITGGCSGANGTSSPCADGGQGWNNGIPTAGLCRTQCGGYGLGGGGGSSSTQDHGGGGGGGYSGGGAAWDGGAGGGGSLNNGTNQLNTQGVQSGNGQVIISY